MTRAEALDLLDRVRRFADMEVAVARPADIDKLRLLSSFIPACMYGPGYLAMRGEVGCDAATGVRIIEMPRRAAVSGHGKLLLIGGASGKV